MDVYCCCASGVSGDEYKAGPLAEYERRIAAGELKSGDEFQVLGLSFWSPAHQQPLLVGFFYIERRSTGIRLFFDLTLSI